MVQAEFVEDVGVGAGEIGDGAQRLHVRCCDGRGDQVTVHGVKVDRHPGGNGLLAEGHENETGRWHGMTLLLQTGINAATRRAVGEAAEMAASVILVPIVATGCDAITAGDGKVRDDRRRVLPNDADRPRRPVPAMA